MNPERLNPALLLAALIVVCLVLAGCNTTKEVTPVVQVVERRTEVPKSLLHCLPEPTPKEPWKESTRPVLSFMTDLRTAGRDCRSKLESVRGLLETEASSSPTP